MTSTTARHGRQLAAAVVSIGALSLLVPTIAHAAIASEASASIPVTSAKWSATASASTVPFLKLKDNSRSGVFTVTNSGDLALSGFTLRFTGTTGTSTQLTVTSCVGGTWAESGSGSNKTHSCSGSAVGLGTASSGSRTVTVSLAAAASVSLRVTASGPSSGATGSTTVSVQVPRSNARAAQARS